MDQQLGLNEITNNNNNNDNDDDDDDDKKERKKRRKMTPETDVEKPRQAAVDTVHVGNGLCKGRRKPQAEQ